jgi:hypothetical protein
MSSPPLPANPWDEFAGEYARDLVGQGPLVVDDGMASRLLDLLGAHDRLRHSTRQREDHERTRLSRKVAS